MPEAQRSGSTQSYIQSVLGLLPKEVNPLMKRRRKVSPNERVLAPVSTKPTETRPRPTYAAVTRKYRAPVQKFPPEPRKTDVWRTADNRPVCFHCGRPEHVMRYCRERLSLTTLETADGIRRHPRRHIADPVVASRRARKTKERPSRSRFWASFSVISDKYRRFLKKVLFADAKSVMLKVADGNFVRPIGKCVLRVRINNRELPFEFIVLSHCSHDVILGWDFLEASQAVIDCGQNELVLEDICRDSTAPDAWNLYATRDYTLKPHSLTRITVSGYQTRGDINVVLDGSKHLLFEKNIATPSMVSTYRNGKSDVWVTNLQFETKSSLEECA
ncbi:transposon Ty3-I Gag-Pol polyprotein [Trichonephila clavipes]|nr:transposon Ty3-I Gag-Pol polyprotein [Trichonephila clavipes]